MVFLSLTQEVPTLKIIISPTTKVHEVLNTCLFSPHVGLNYHVFEMLVVHVPADIYVIVEKLL